MPRVRKGAARRQARKRVLNAAKGYRGANVVVDAPLAFEVAGEHYRSRIDLLVMAGQPLRPFMAIKCAAGSLGSREREIVSAARIYDPAAQIPLAVVSDGQQAIVLDAVSGRKLAEGMAAIPDYQEANRRAGRGDAMPYPPERMERERLIFRSYDQLNVNVARPKKPDQTM